MEKTFNFEIIQRSTECPLARAGTIHTPHGDIATPAFIPVGTKATVKSLSPEIIKSIGAQAVLANTYHLYLQPGQDIVEAHKGFAKMMNWTEDDNILPTFTDSGGFQVLSLGAAFDTGVSKIATSGDIAKIKNKIQKENDNKPVSYRKSENVTITEEGVQFKSVIDGSRHFFSPEISMQIQHKLGADIFFAFDECTSPLAPREYQEQAMNRTHRWAVRCIDEHKRLGISTATGSQQALFAVVQGGGYNDLREISARELSAMDFDGFGIGGSFTKEDMKETVLSVTNILPESKPRHLLGIGEPIDFFIGIEMGIDTFDCVSPTRIARHGNIYSYDGQISIRNSKYINDYSPICSDIDCPANKYTKSYLSHLYRSKEMYAATIASAHNLHFLIKLVNNIRESILENRFFEYKKTFCDRYYRE